MLTFYYHPLSPIARRVWICLLEKGIEFQAQVVQLHLKEQFEAEFLALNPFHHVPVLVDGDVKLIESIAILDYLDAQYPQPCMTPQTPAELGKMRMIQMVTMNEIMNCLSGVMAAGKEHPKAETLTTGLEFLELRLEGDYFGGNCLNLADCIVGSTLPLFRRLGVRFDQYAKLSRWMDRLYDRPSWQKTEPTEEAFEQWRRFVEVMIARKASKKG